MGSLSCALLVPCGKRVNTIYLVSAFGACFESGVFETDFWNPGPFFDGGLLAEIEATTTCVLWF